MRHDTKRTALIIGVTGQDGAYISKLLLDKGYKVFGSSRDVVYANTKHLEYLNILDDIDLITINPSDFYDVIRGIEQSIPDELYVLGSQSSVGLSFSQPFTTIESTTMGILNILEAVRFLKLDTKIYHASSGEIFGNAKSPVDEKYSICPVSPYGVAKATASHIVKVYRDSYGVFAVNGFLFNHESPLRGERFVTKIIISAAYNIYRGKADKLTLGNMEIIRDWGWAPEYVNAMFLMLQNTTPIDYIIGTGKSYSLTEFVSCAFSYFDLNYEDHLESDSSILRPNELKENYCNPKKANYELKWKATYFMPDVVRMMCDYMVADKA